MRCLTVKAGKVFEDTQPTFLALDPPKFFSKVLFWFYKWGLKNFHFGWALILLPVLTVWISCQFGTIFENPSNFYIRPKNHQNCGLYPKKHCQLQQLNIPFCICETKKKIAVCVQKQPISWASKFASIEYSCLALLSCVFFGVTDLYFLNTNCLTFFGFPSAQLFGGRLDNLIIPKPTCMLYV